MSEPLFPIKPAASASAGILMVEPYRHDGAWVFDDPNTGLLREPFVSGISEMIDHLVSTIPSASTGFRLYFADHTFDGWQDSLVWVRADPVEGHWYRADNRSEEGWLCPALFFYFQAPPARIYVRAEAKPAT